MKNNLVQFLIALFFVAVAQAQIDGGLLLGLTQATTAEISLITNPIKGSLLYNTTLNQVYQYNGSAWSAIGETTNSWGTTGNAGTSTTTNFIGTSDARDLVLKAKGTEKLRLVQNKGQVLVNRATSFKDHPLVLRANGNDILAFEDSAGVPKWHWNILGGGLNFVESNVADYRLFLKNGGNVGFDTSNPAYTADINGTARIVNTPTITTANKVLVKNPVTGQISEQNISNSQSGKFFQNFQGRAYFYKNVWRSPHDQYGVGSQNWSQSKGNSTNPSYSTSNQSGMAIPSDCTLIKFNMKNDFNGNPNGTQQINLAVLRGNSYITIGTYALIGVSTSISMHSQNTNFQLLENDLLVWACRTTGSSNRVSYASLTFEFAY